MDRSKFYRATRPFRYFGVRLWLGQIVQLKGGANDESLVRLGYLEETSAKVAEKAAKCRGCDGRFETEAMRDMHGRELCQRPEPKTEAEAERESDRLEKLVNQIARPLALERAKGQGGMLPRRRASAER